MTAAAEVGAANEDDCPPTLACLLFHLIHHVLVIRVPCSVDEALCGVLVPSTAVFRTPDGDE